MMRWLLQLFGVCRHDGAIKERDPRGVLHLCCPDCGHRVEALQRTAKERKAIAKQFPAVVARKAQRSQPQADVVAIGKGRRR